MIQPLLFFALLVISARFLEEIMIRIGQSQTLGDILAGIAVGPAVLNLVQPVEEIRFLVDLGLFFFFFIIGFREIDLPTLRRVFRRRLFPGAIVAFIIPVLVCNIFLLSVGMEPGLSALVSSVAGISSLGILTRTLMDLNMMKNHIGLETFGFVALIEFAGLMFVTVLLEFYLVEVSDEMYYILSLMASLVVFLVVIGVFSFVIAPRLLTVVQKHMRVKEASFGIIASLVLLVVWFSEMMGVHGSIGALLFGLGLSRFLNTPEHIEMIQGFRSFSYGIFIPVFFAGTGLYFSFSFLSMSYVFLLSFIMVVIIGKFAGALAGAKLAGSKNSAFIGLASLSKGGVELALILSMFGTGILDNDTFSLLLFTLFVMLVVSPLFMKALARRLPVDASMSMIEEEMMPLYCRYAYLNLQAKDVMSSAKARVHADMTLTQFLKEHLKLGYRNYFVVDSDEHLVGLLKVTDLSTVPDTRHETTLVSDIMRKNIPMLFPETSVHMAVEILLNEGLNRLPVVSSDDPQTVIGTFDRGDAIKLVLLDQKQVNESSTPKETRT